MKEGQGPLAPLDARIALVWVSAAAFLHTLRSCYEALTIMDARLILVIR